MHTGRQTGYHDPMNKVIFLTDRRHADPDPALAAPAGAEGPPLLDTRARPLRDLRISVTDRCNFRCTYCMPREVFDSAYPFMPHSALLSFEEITRLARVFAAQGVEKIRLTGGEPLLRKNIEILVGMLAQLRTPDGRALDLTLTTNGVLLARKAKALAEAGLNRVTVSLDAMDDAVFRRMSDTGYGPADVLRGIDAAAEAGLGPIKVNMVVQRGANDDQILPMARHFRGTGHILRFIEYMDVGTTNGWNMSQVVSGREILDRIDREYPLQPEAAHYTGEVAKRWRYVDGAGEIGVITSVTHAFCGECSRARLSPEGRLYTCLFATQGYDLREVLRGGADDAGLARTLAGIWSGRRDAYSEQRARMPAGDAAARKIEMSYIGG